MNKTQALLITSLGHFINDGNLFLMPLLYAFMIKYLGASTLLAGISAGLFSVTSMLVSPLVPRTARKLGGYSKAMGFGFILWGLSLILLGLNLKIGNYIGIFLSIILSGIASVYYHPLGATILSSAYGGSAGTALGVNGAMGSVGRSTYQYISLILFVIFNSNILLALLALALVSIIVGIPPIFMTDPPSYEVHREHQANLNTSYTMKYSLIYVITIITVVSLFRGIFFQGVLQFLPTLLIKYFNYSYGENLGLIMMVIYSAAILGQPMLGILSDHIGRRVVFGLTSASAVIAFLLFYLSHEVLWAIIFAFFALSSFPLSMALIGDLAPRDSAGMASSIVWNVGNSGGMTLGPIIVGVLSTIMILPKAMLVVSIAGLIASILTIGIPKPPKRSKVPLFG